MEETTMMRWVGWVLLFACLWGCKKEEETLKQDAMKALSELGAKLAQGVQAAQADPQVGGQKPGDKKSGGQNPFEALAQLGQAFGSKSGAVGGSVVNWRSL
jgi:hypothetical protein